MPEPTDPFLDGLPCGFLRIDETGTVLAANEPLAELVGIARERIIGQPMDIFLSAAGRIFHSTHLFPLLRLHGRAEEVYVPLRAVDAGEVPVLVNGAARDLDGRTVYDLVLVPMRQRHELESELLAARRVAEQAASAKDRFLSIVSHELRTPISAVSGYAELLLRQRVGPLTDKQREYAERILASARYQATLIDDILDFARQTGERRTLEATRIPLEEALERVESLLAIRARDQDQSLVREPTPAPGAVLADPRALQQILLNLGTNALKYSPSSSTVRIGARADGDRVRVSVADEGTGIAESDLKRIFEPFVQLESAETPPSGRRGVGLGLAISRELARAMGGDLTVTSVVGEGSTFTLDLPSAG